MRYNVGDVYLDDDARRVEKELDDETNHNFYLASKEAYNNGFPIIKGFYSDLVDGKLYYPSFGDLSFWDDEKINNLQNKYGIGCTSFDFSYIKNDYIKNDYTEYIKENTGKYDINVDIDEHGYGRGSLDPVIKTTEVKHHKVKVLEQRKAYGAVQIPHWFEKHHKYSNEGISCLYFLNRFDGFYEANYKKLSNGKLFHPRLNYIFSIIFLFMSLALFFVSAYSLGNVSKIAFEATSLFSMILCFVFFLRLRIKKVDLPVIHYVFFIIEFAVSVLSFILLILFTYVPFFKINYFNFIVASRFVPFVLWIISLFFVHDSFVDYCDDQKAMYKLDAFKKYPYFKDNYKKIIVARNTIPTAERQPQKIDVIANEASVSSQKEATKGKTEIYCLIKEMDENNKNKIIAMIIKEMDVSVEYALKALKGKKTITLNTGMLLKKEFPSMKIIKYTR